MTSPDTPTDNNLTAGAAPSSPETRLVSWNVNGLRALLKKDPSFQEIFDALDADVFALQETKVSEGQVALELPGYFQTWSYAAKAGYSGTAVFSREEPRQVVRTIGCPVADDEGRVCALEFESFWFVDVYVPNSQDGLRRLDVRLEWDERYREFLSGLAAEKPVITCGDFNVAHEEIDIKNPGPNRGHAGFSDEERASFTKLLDAGFTDTFRLRHPDVTGAYTWWSYRRRARLTNAGWRIDYFLVSDDIADRVESASILDEVYGSDHCPIELSVAL